VRLFIPTLKYGAFPGAFRKNIIVKVVREKPKEGDRPPLVPVTPEVLQELEETGPEFITREIPIGSDGKLSCLSEEPKEAYYSKKLNLYKPENHDIFLDGIRKANYEMFKKTNIINIDAHYKNWGVDEEGHYKLLDLDGFFKVQINKGLNCQIFSKINPKAIRPSSSWVVGYVYYNKSRNGWKTFRQFIEFLKCEIRNYTTSNLTTILEQLQNLLWKQNNNVNENISHYVRKYCLYFILFN
jgi:hypothetical protein